MESMREREREREANLAEKKKACIGQINLYNFIITFSYSELLEKATHCNWVSNLAFESFDVVGIFVFWLLNWLFSIFSILDVNAYGVHINSNYKHS